MSLKTFVQNHRHEIDAIIDGTIYRYDGNGGRGTIPYPPPRHNDAERAQWVQNEEGLYLWFKREQREKHRRHEAIYGI